MNPVEEPSRENLLLLAQAGDPDSLGRLLERYRPYLLLLARLEIGRRVQGKADPADVVQDVFLEAARHFPAFRGTSESEFTAWLRQILATSIARLLRHYLGTQARDIRLERQLADDLDRSSAAIPGSLVASQSSPSQRASQREQAVILAEALERLPPDYREVLVLRHLEGLTFPVIAQRMGRSLDSVEKLWVRALPKLKQLLGETA
jgi:RNA polymerase sigma-70 factor (ECF subfamily)